MEAEMKDTMGQDQDIIKNQDMEDQDMMEDIISWSVTGVLVLLLVVATIVIVVCILRRTPSAEIGGQSRRTLRSRFVDYVGRYVNVGNSDAPEWDWKHTRPGSLSWEYGDKRSSQMASGQEDNLHLIS